MTDNTKNLLSIQTLRLMRQTIENSSQYSDDELNASGVILGSLFSMMNEVPGFLNPKEQQSFFTNLISCFIVSDLINNGFVNPHMAESYLANISEQARAAMQLNSQEQAPDEDALSAANINGKTPIN